MHHNFVIIWSYILFIFSFSLLCKIIKAAKIKNLWYLKSISTCCVCLWEVKHFWNTVISCQAMSQCSFPFWICEQRIQFKNALGLCFSKTVLNDNEKRGCKDNTAVELLLTGMFFRFSHKVLTVLCQLVGLKNKKQSCLSGARWSLPRSSRVLGALVQMFQCHVIYSVSKCQSPTTSWFALRSDATASCRYPESAQGADLGLSYNDSVEVTLNH